MPAYEVHCTDKGRTTVRTITATSPLAALRAAVEADERPGATARPAAAKRRTSGHGRARRGKR